MSKREAPVIVKKVSAYPIDVEVVKTEGGSPPFKMKIVKLTKVGFFVEAGELMFKVGDVYGVSFVLPVFNAQVKATVVVIKTLDRYVDNQASGKSRLVEMHFKGLSAESQNMIVQFNNKIGQK